MDNAHIALFLRRKVANSHRDAVTRVPLLHQRTCGVRIRRVGGGPWAIRTVPPVPVRIKLK